MSLKKKLVWLPYDFDTAIGINNEGALVFSYELEDTDHLTGGADIFNGQESVIWNNIRDAFGDELKAMYQTLRSTGALSYAKVEQMFEEHQAKWPEAIFNEDAWFKYIDPLVNDGDGAYLDMLQGSKAEQRKWWLYNRFRYIDSKYNAGDALSDLIQLRGYAKADITVKPYADIYPAVKYGSYLVTQRGKRLVSTTLTCPLDNVNDTEIYIYSASQLASVGDLSGFKVGFANFSMATRLQEIKIGDPDSNYDNPNLASLTLGNNVLLKKIDVRNCSGLGDTSKEGHTQQTVDISGCSIVEEVYFDGTKITGLTLPNGGVLKKLHLPATITNLTILNQNAITEFVLPSYTNISTLRLENVPTLDTKAILNSVSANTRVRLIGFTWEATNAAEIEALLDKLDTMRGLDENGNNMDTAQVSGTIHTNSLTGAQISSYNARYPYLTVTADHTTSYLTYANYDGSSTVKVVTCIDGVPQESAPSGPSRASTAANTFTFIGWSKTPNSTTVDADAAENVIADRTIYAAYSVTGRTYTVRFYNGSTLLQTVNNVAYGSNASYTGTTPVSPDGSAEDYPFEGWSPSPNNIQGDTNCYAVFGSPLEVAEITDDWSTIISKITNGTATYKVGNYKPLDLGTEGIVNMEIVGKNTSPLASGSGYAMYDWLSKELLTTSHRMNPDIQYGTKSVASWTASNNIWTSQNRYAVSTAKATWTVTAAEAGTFTIAYKTSNANASRNKITKLTVNGTDVITNYANTTGSSHNVEVAANDIVTVYCEYDLLSTSYNYSATITFSGTGAFTVSAEVQNANTRGDAISGTGTIGGWEACEMRTYLKNTIKPLIPEVVRNAIKPVIKYSRIYNTSAQAVNNVTSTEDVWLPSMREMNFSGYETEGPQYKAAFPDAASRVKMKAGTSSASFWWCRSASSSSPFLGVYSSGSASYSGANSSYPLPLGFST